MRGRRSAIAAAAAAVAIAGIVAAGLLIGTGSDQPALDSASTKAIPTIGGQELRSGEQISLDDFAGKPVVLNVWASWCPGCADEAPDLRRFAASHPEAVVLGIDLRDDVDAARRFAARFGWRHQSIVDPKGALAAKLGLYGLPTTIFLTPSHREAARIEGATDLSGFEAGLAQALTAP